MITVAQYLCPPNTIIFYNLRQKPLTCRLSFSCFFPHRYNNYCERLFLVRRRSVYSNEFRMIADFEISVGEGLVPQHIIQNREQNKVSFFHNKNTIIIIVTQLNINKLLS